MTAAAQEIIDLGVLDPVATEPGGPMFSAGMRRTLLSALVTLLCLLSLGASAVREPGLYSPLWTGTVTLNGFSLGPDVLFSTGVDGHTVIARDLRNGKQLWQLEVAEIPEYSEDIDGGVTAVSTRQLDSQSSRPRGSITFVRTGTGEVIGRAVGGTSGRPSIGGLPLVMSSVRDGCVAPDMSCLTLSGFDLADGSEVWRTDLPPDSYVSESLRDGRVAGLATVSRDGTVQMRDLASGSVLTSVHLPELAAGGQLVLLPGVLITATRTGDGDQVTVNGYERPALTRIWSVEVSVPLSDEEFGNGVWPSECGADACLYGNSGTVWLIDPATGKIKANTGLNVVSRLGNGVFLAGEPGPASGGPRRIPQSGIVLDASLRMVGRLTVTDQVWWLDSGNRALFTQAGKDRTGFVEVDEQGRQRTLGSVPGTELTCDAHGRYLACVDHGGTLRVWRLPD